MQLREGLFHVKNLTGGVECFVLCGFCSPRPVLAGYGYFTMVRDAKSRGC